MIATAWQLGGGKLSPNASRFCKWTHMLGYGGHGAHLRCPNDASMP